MKHAHFILGLTMLCVAGTVAAYIVSQPPAGPNEAREQADRQGAAAGSPAGATSTTRSKAVRIPVLLGAVDAPGQDPVLMERAALVEAAAHQRLAELNEQLALTRKQQAQIFPLLARSSPHYDESLHLTGRRGHSLVAPINRRAAEREIYDLLDAGQQADLDGAAAEKDLWWSAVISRLERELENSTQSRESSSEPPAASPPETAPPASAGGPPPGRRGSLLNGE